MSDDDVQISVTRNGPYTIKGPARLVDQDGNVWQDLPEGKVVALCRCGRSSHKPFCDGTHNKVEPKFESEPTPESQPYPW